MTAGGEAVEDYGHVGLTLRAHPVTFLRVDPSQVDASDSASVTDMAGPLMLTVPSREFNSVVRVVGRSSALLSARQNQPPTTANAHAFGKARNLAPINLDSE